VNQGCARGEPGVRQGRAQGEFEENPGKIRKRMVMVPRIGILCLGNILLQDEGVGPRVAEELLRRYFFPENVEVLDRGTMGMALLADIKNFDVILLVDAVNNTGLEPGTVVTYLPEDIAPYETFHGAHDIRLADVLDAAALLGYNPAVHCLGVQVQNMSPADYTIKLSPSVEASLPILIQCALNFLERFGAKVIEKQQAT